MSNWYCSSKNFLCASLNTSQFYSTTWICYPSSKFLTESSISCSKFCTWFGSSNSLLLRLYQLPSEDNSSIARCSSFKYSTCASMLHMHSFFSSSKLVVQGHVVSCSIAVFLCRIASGRNSNFPSNAWLKRRLINIWSSKVSSAGLCTISGTPSSLMT